MGSGGMGGEGEFQIKKPFNYPAHQASVRSQQRIINMQSHLLPSPLAHSEPGAAMLP